MPPLDFQIRRDDLRTCRFGNTATPALQPGQIRLRIDRLALTANNITYAALGEAMGYWQFFPAPESWGHLPAWGFADVIESRCAQIASGARYYGYFPVATEVVLQPGTFEARGFLDDSPHRQALNPLYNRYLDTRVDPDYSAAQEDEIALQRPLFLTSFVLDDFLARNAGFGAHTAILSSASSKTAYGLAALLQQRHNSHDHSHDNSHDKPRWEVVGLTSARNRYFCESLGVYSRVLAYDAIDTLPRTPSVYIDMAGDRNVRTALHTHLNEQLRYSCAVGATHWEQPPKVAGAKLPGPKAVMFFAPGEIEARIAEWGLAGFQQRYSASWQQFLARDFSWLDIEHASGAESIARIYRELLDGRTPPQRGYIVTPAA